MGWHQEIKSSFIPGLGDVEISCYALSIWGTSRLSGIQTFTGLNIWRPFLILFHSHVVVKLSNNSSMERNRSLLALTERCI